MFDSPRCAKCGGHVSVLPSVKSQLCGSCVLAWAFEPCGLSVGITEPVLSWGGDAPVLGPYVLIEEIGRGGMGVIYRGVHYETCEEVALKAVLPQYADNPEILARFQREAELAQSLDHPNMMPILEIGCSEKEVPFIVMPLARGGSLHDLKARYHQRWRRVAELMVKVARAIHHAHSRGVLHRDIKPSNILFTEDHEPLVADFGLAKPLAGSDDLTRSRTVLGTPNYVSPEQAGGQTVQLTVAADIYSLGAVLFELLTGRPPFVGDNALDVLRQVSTKTPVRPRRIVPAVPKALEHICLRCLERAPANRYASARGLVDDLERWLDGRSVTPQPVNLRVNGFFGRHPIIGKWSGLVGLLLIALPFIWKTVERPIVNQPPTSIAIVIDEMEPSVDSQQIARQLANQLRQALLKSSGFHIKERPNGNPVPISASLDSLSFARSISSQTVLTSHLRESGSQLHLVMQFVRCDTGETIWQRRDIFSLDHAAATLSTITEAVVEHLKQSWDERLEANAHASYRPIAEAQDFYTHAMELAAHGSRRDMEAAVELFQRARKADPQFAQACAMLAFAQWTMAYGYGEYNQFALAEGTARDALALDPNSAQAHRVLASCYEHQAHYNEAREEFEIAVELAPSSAGCCQSLGICLREMGHPDRAIPWLRRAVQLEPAHGSFSTSLGEALILCDLDEEAEAAFTRAAELNPERPGTQFAMAALRVWQTRYDEARILCVAASHRFPDYRLKLDFAAWIEFCDGRLSAAQDYYVKLRAENSYQEQWVFYGGINPSSALAYVAFQSGSVEQAQTLASEALRIDRELLTKYPNNNRILHDIAATYAVTGDKQNALLYLGQALTAGWAEHRSTKIDPRFSTLAHVPAFAALLESTKPKYNADTAF